MALRRVLVTAPLAVLVALTAHVAGFGGDHVLGGVHAAGLLALGVGGSILLAILALGWVGLTETDAGRAERALRAMLPARGGIFPAALVLGVSGSIVFACGELLEGHLPPVTLGSLLAITASAVVIAAVARGLARWLAAGGVALASLIPLARRPSAAPARAAERADALLAPPSQARGARRGRAPPHSA
jgi:hypothetical protein